MMARSVVVLPAPLRPIRQTSSPAPTASEMARRMRLFWMSTTTSLSASMLGNPRQLAGHLADDRGDERRVAEERVGRTVGEHLAGLQRHDAARVFRDQVHVVLDQDDRL